MKKLLLIFSFMFLLTGCNEEVEYHETNKVNLNEAAIEDKIIGNIKTSNTSIIFVDGITTFKTELSANEETYIKQIKITFKNNHNSEITTLTGYVDKNIKDNYEVVITSDIDLTNAYNIEYSFE